MRIFFRILALLFACTILAMGVLLYSGDKAPPNQEVPEDTNGPRDWPMLTLKEFDGLNDGISYEEAQARLGREGFLFSSTTLGNDTGERATTEIYTWTNADGTYIHLTFAEKKLANKR